MAAISRFFDAMHGVVFPFAGDLAPEGFLLCDGGEHPIASYPSLHAVLGSKFNLGDESVGFFRIPDLRGRVIAGIDNMGGTAANRLQVSPTLSTTSGSASATVSSNVGLATGMEIISPNVPAGTKITNVVGTTITMSAAATATASWVARFSLLGDAQAHGSTGGGAVHTLTEGQMPQHNHNIRVNPSGSGGAAYITTNVGSTFLGSVTSLETGGSQAHPNVQPTILLNYIIKT